MQVAVRSLVVTAIVIAMSVAPAVAEAKGKPSETNVLQRLAQPVTLEFADLALKDLPHVLRKTCRVDVEVDLAALQKSGVDDNLKLSLYVRGVSLHSALRLLLRPHELGWKSRGHVLVITPVEKSHVERFYPAEDLMPWRFNGKHGARDARSLVDLVQYCIARYTWKDNGGSGSVRAFGSVLAVSQTEEVHQEVQSLLCALRHAGMPVEMQSPAEPASEGHDNSDGQDPFDDAGADPFNDSSSAPFGGAGPDPFGDAGADPFVDAPVRRVLRQPRTEPIPIRPAWVVRREAELQTLLAVPLGKLKVPESPLRDVIRLLAERSGAPLVIEDGVLDVHEFSPQKTASLDSDGHSLAAVLRRLLAPWDLTYEIRDELIFVTSGDCPGDALVSVVYPVADLVSDLALDEDGPDELMEVFTQIEHDSWQDVGGLGTVEYFEPTRVMLVTNTREVHDTIAGALSELRKARGPRAAPAAADRRRRWEEELVWQGFRWRDVGDPHWSPASQFGGGMSAYMGGGMFSVDDAEQSESQPEPPRPAPLSRQERECLKKLIVDALPTEPKKTPVALVLVREHEVLVRHRRATVIALERNLSDAPLIRTLSAHWYPDVSSGVCGSVIPVVGRGR